MSGPANLKTLRTTLGDDGMLATASDRFERKLAEESARIRISLIRWMFAFWIANVSVTATIKILGG